MNVRFYRKHQQTFRIGRSRIKLSTASADGATTNWPLGLFWSEHTFAIIVFAAIPKYNIEKNIREQSHEYNRLVAYYQHSLQTMKHETHCVS